MKYIFFFFVSCLSLSCNPSNDEQFQPSPPQEPPPPSTQAISYLALGDSYTIGQSVDPHERFPEQLADSLRLLDLNIETLQIIAKTGWTTDELQGGIDAAPDIDPPYGLVSLLIGVNNQFRGRTVESYEPEFTELLEQAIDFAGGRTDRVFVVSIPDYAFTPYGQANPTISNGIDAYNAANRAIAEAFDVQYFNITPISREGLDKPFLVASDGLHPSAEQYARWVELMLPEVRDMLKE